MQYPIPPHCETAIVFEQGIMLVFEPITVPFYYTAYKSDVEDFFDKYCVDCSLRSRSCRKSGAIGAGGCVLGHYIETERITKSIQLSIPKHVLIFAIYDESPKFCYETSDSLQPLKLGNIGDNGWWCNGDVSYTRKNPSSIYNAYFRSIHNADLTNVRAAQYEAYLEQVAEDFKNIERFTYGIDMGMFGRMQYVMHKPTAVTFTQQQTQDYYPVRAYGYVKIS